MKETQQEKDIALQEYKKSLEKALEKDLGIIQRELTVAKHEVKMERAQDIQAALFSFELANNEARRQQLMDQDVRIKKEFDKVESRVSKLEEDIGNLKQGQAGIKQDIASLQQGQEKIMAELQKLNSK